MMIGADRKVLATNINVEGMALLSEQNLLDTSVK